MRIRTGLKALIVLAGLGIAIGSLLVSTCPFAGVLSFSTLVREGTPSYERLTVHATVLPGVRALPAKVLPLFGSEVSFLGTAVLLGLIGLCTLVLRQRTVSIAGVPVTPRAMGLTILGITLWNLLFAGFLIGVEVLALKEL